MCILCVANFTDDGLTIDFCYFHNSELFEIKEGTWVWEEILSNVYYYTWCFKVRVVILLKESCVNCNTTCFLNVNIVFECYYLYKNTSNDTFLYSWMQQHNTNLLFIHLAHWTSKHVLTIYTNTYNHIMFIDNTFW